MALGMIATRRRIRSVNATRKITKAMELVATAKLKKTKDRLIQISNYTNEVQRLIQHVFLNLPKAESVYLDTTHEGPRLFIVMTSNLGLCGGYNSNVIKRTKEKINPGDYLITMGLKGTYAFQHGSNKPFLVIEDDRLGHEYEVARTVAQTALDLYRSHTVSSIELIYTHYVNSITFDPTHIKLLPLTPEDLTKGLGKPYSKDTLFEPSLGEALDQLVPMYVESVLYGRLMEARVSEQASRRTAMENATDNADELKEKLMIQYNKARQSAITQEIAEVVAGAAGV